MQLAALCFICCAAVFFAPAAGVGGQGPHTDALPEVNITYTITATEDIYEALDDARAKNFLRIALALPSDTLTITQPIRISTKTVLLGSGLSPENGAPASILQCGSSGTGLLVLDGPELTLRGVQLQGCSRPGLVATLGSNASITITDSVFSSFTRQLGPGRVNITDGAAVARVSNDTAALAIHLDGFRGSLTVARTRFVNNTFSISSDVVAGDATGSSGGGAGSSSEAPQRRRSLQSADWSALASVLTVWRNHPDARPSQQDPAEEDGVGSPFCSQGAGAICQAELGARGSGAAQQGWLSSGPGVWAGPGPGKRSRAWAGRRSVRGGVWSQGVWSRRMGSARRGRRARRQLAEALPQGREELITGLLLTDAQLIHPGLQEGPWADDMEAAVAVICSSGSSSGSGRPVGSNGTLGDSSGGPGDNATCTVTLDQVAMEDNTGVATGALYLLCDGMARCDFTLTDCTVERNKLLWQGATEPDQLLDGLDTGLDLEYDYSDYDDIPPVAGDGVRLLMRMVPWLTYTYPLISFFQQEAAFDGSPVQDPAEYPTVTGRTLGAVVIHTRNPPAVGSNSSVPAMLSATVSGGSFSGNDGCAIASTATDWQQLAGGSGSWSGALLRHATDVTLMSVRVEEHASGWPAVWLRWPRRATVTNCTITRSTGAAWLDEVRDHAQIDNSSFTDNTLNQKWLDYHNFEAAAPPLNFDFGTQLGVGLSHTVKVQMTPMGTVDNSVAISNCTFQGNPSFLTGTLYIKSSDQSVPEGSPLPGNTSVEIINTKFLQNLCRKDDSGLGPACQTGERPVYIVQTAYASIKSCRFEGNNNGGLYVEFANGLTVTDSTFGSNALTYGYVAIGADAAYVGAGLYGSNVGTVVIVGSTFANNAAALGGGAVGLKDFASSNFSNVRFLDNIGATYDGGAVQLYNASARASTTFTNCTFLRNAAGRSGGAVSAGLLLELRFQDCTMVNNTAMLNPMIRFGNVYDQAGGGALFVKDTALLDASYLVMYGNKVLAFAGGALCMVDSGTASMTHSSLTSNVALVGGAMALTRLQDRMELRNCTFTNNTVVDPWAWPDTTPVPGITSRLPIVQYAYLDMGYGGAVYAKAARLYIVDGVTMSYNSAKIGGAVAQVMSDLSITVRNATGLPSQAVPLPPSGLAEASGFRSWSFGLFFGHNSALIGGALYVYKPFLLTISTDRSSVFYNNTANGGGAIYVQAPAVPQFILAKPTIKGVAFVSNTAKPSPLVEGYTGLYGLEKDNGTAAGHECQEGGGGAVCIVGLAGTTLALEDLLMYDNTAQDGGAVYVGEGDGCVDQTGCYKVQLKQVAMAGNAAAGRGGGIFWRHEGVVSALQCLADRPQSVSVVNGTATTPWGNTSSPVNATGGATGPLLQYSVSVSLPGRKLPSPWYGRLTRQHRSALLASVGGTVNVTLHALYSVNGSVKGVDGIAYVRFTSANTTLLSPEGVLLAAPGTVLNMGTGFLSRAAALTAPPLLPGTIDVSGRPVVLDSSPINDTSWYGIPYDQLPCADWNNTAAAGDDIATTPYFLLNPPRIDYYSSNTDIRLSVTVHDWLGANCTVTGSTSPVVVRADSPEVAGNTAIPVANGTAEYTSLRLRGREGIHNISFQGQTLSPNRDLMPSQVQVYVRPCSINEFLAPKNLDECIPCEPDNYNLDVSAVSCKRCPDDAECRNPDPEACTEDASGACPPQGYLVPQDGYWHSSFFSEEVLECPNADSCTAEGRSEALSAMQLQLWQIARSIQFQSSQLVADDAANTSDSESVSSGTLNALKLRRLLQVKGINDTDYFTALANLSSTLLPQYMQAQCAIGYRGILCSECDVGYGWSDEATCVKCRSKPLNDFLYSLVTLLTLSVLAFAVYASLKEQPPTGRLVGGMGPATAEDTQPDPGADGSQSAAKDAGSPRDFSRSVLQSDHARMTEASSAIRSSGRLASLEDNTSSEVLPSLTQDPPAPQPHVEQDGQQGNDQVALATATPFATVEAMGAVAAPRAVVSATELPEQAASPYAGALKAGWLSRISSSRSSGGGGRAPKSGSGRWKSSEALRLEAQGEQGEVDGRGSMGVRSALEGEKSWRKKKGPSSLAAADIGTPTDGESVTIVLGESGTEGHGAGSGADSGVEAGAAARGSTSGAEGGGMRSGERGLWRLLSAGKSGGGGGPLGEGREQGDEEMPRSHASSLPPFEQQQPSSTSPSVSSQWQGSRSVFASDSSRLSAPPRASLRHLASIQPSYGYASGSPLPYDAVIPEEHVANMGDPADPGASRQQGLAGAGSIKTDYFEDADEYTLPRKHAHQSTVVKIFISYVQVLALFRNIPLEIPGLMDVYYRVNNQATSYPGALVALDCSLPPDGTTAVSRAVTRVVLAVTAPLYIFAGAVIFFLLWNVFEYYFWLPYKRKRKVAKGKKVRRDIRLPTLGIHIQAYLMRQLIVSFITIMFFFYPNVVQSIMSIFDCQYVDTDNDSSNPLSEALGRITHQVWKQDFGQKCYAGSHLGLVLGLGVPGLVFIAAGWPLASALLVSGKLPCITNIQLTEDMTEFFLADFKERWVWWDSVVMMRKLAVAIIVTFVDGPTTAGVQLLLVVCILVVALALHLVVMPYHHRRTNDLEQASLYVLLATLYLSLYFGYSSTLADAGRYAISIIIVSVNVVMAAVFVYFIVRAYWYAALHEAGLDHVDKETRKQLTAEEVRERYLQRAALSKSSSKGTGSEPSNTTISTRTKTFASVYATAVVAGMRLGTTTSRALSRVRTFIEPRDSGLTINTQYSVRSGEEQPYAPYPHSYPPYNDSGYAADAEQLGGPSTNASMSRAYRTASDATRAASRHSSMARGALYGAGAAGSFAGMPGPPQPPYPSASYRRAPDPRGLGSGAGAMQRFGASGRYAGGSASALGPPVVPRTQRLGSVGARLHGVPYPGAPGMAAGQSGLGPKSASIVLPGRMAGLGVSSATESGPNTPQAEGPSSAQQAAAGGVRATTGSSGHVDGAS